MKLGEALALLKKEKGRLAKLVSLRKDNVYVEKGKKSPFDPNKLGIEINKKIENIRKLKIKIQKTNLNAKIEEEDLCIAETIIMVGDIRSKLAALSNLFTEKKDSFFRWRNKDEIERISQLDENKIDSEMEELENYKIKLDNQIQVANWKTELID